MTRPTAVPRRAMVLAAGLGTRMRPITDTLPKALVPVLGRTLIDWSLDRLEEFGIELVVVNVHHLADQVEEHLARRWTPAIKLSRETDRLETGGGVVKALAVLGDAPFFVVNSDILWLNGPVPALRRVAEAWDDERMDGLLLLQRTVSAVGYQGSGDFLMDCDGKLSRKPENRVAPYLFAGVQILHPRLFNDAPDGSFSLNRLFDAAIARGRLFGILHDGAWYHVGTPDDIAATEAHLRTLYADVRWA